MGEVRKLWIEGPAGRLECTLRLARNARAVAVLAHPHPLHGGTLSHPVLFHVDRELNRGGWSTLRFNFRGVGTSEGRHDEGRGEVEDVAAAASWLRGVANGVPLVLVGYSFGAWCCLRYAGRDPAVAAVITIGLPVRVYDLASAGPLVQPVAVVQGSDDELGSPAEVRSALDRAGIRAEISIVPGASHLFPGRASEVAAAARDAADRLLES